MLKKSFFILIAILVLLLSCTPNFKDSNKKEISKNDSFELFFKKFAKDSLYQKSHIKFPLERRVFEIEENESIKVINIDNWEYIDFRCDRRAYKSKYDKYEIYYQVINSDKIIYVRSGIDNGIYMEYLFEQAESEWFLVRITDKST